jgi:cytidylate kinase
MKITISGLPGAGKTTVGKELAQFFKCEFLSVGDLRGKFALENNLTIDELNKKGKTDPTVDTRFDEHQKKYGRKNKKFVIEGRLSYHFVPDSIKIFLIVDKIIGAKRIFKDQRPDEKKYNTLKETSKTIENRIKNDKERYLNIYKINPYDLTQYDIVIDTTEIPSEKMLKVLLKRIKLHQK